MYYGGGMTVCVRPTVKTKQYNAEIRQAPSQNREEKSTLAVKPTIINITFLVRP